MEKINYKKEIIMWIMLIVPLIYIGYVWDQLPATIAIHYDMRGEANGWGDKSMIFFMSGISVALYLLLLFIPQIDPKKMQGEFFYNNFYKIRLVNSVFCFALSLVFVYMAVTPHAAHMARIIPILALLFLAVLGNFIINVKPNWFIGIRTPWTLSSDHVWKQTHLVFGRIWFYGGLLCTVAVLFAPDVWLPRIILSFVLGSTGFALVYSYILFKREQQDKVSHS